MLFYDAVNNFIDSNTRLNAKSPKEHSLRSDKDFIVLYAMITNLPTGF